MIKKLLQAAVLVAGGLALGGCPLQQAKTTAPANKPPAADYQAASTTPPPPAGSIRAICYNDADLATYRGRMLQQEFTVGTLQCQTAGGAAPMSPCTPRSSASTRLSSAPTPATCRR